MGWMAASMSFLLLELLVTPLNKQMIIIAMVDIFNACLQVLVVLKETGVC